MRYAILTLLACSALLGGDPKPKKPRLDLKAMPKMGNPPLSIHLVAELVGGQDLEEWYCPEIVWGFGDDADQSVQEPECAPFSAGTRIERQFTADHEYSEPGTHSVTVTLRHKGETLAVRSVSVLVVPLTHVFIGKRDPRPMPSPL
jgi:hypothetical protein